MRLSNATYISGANPLTPGQTTRIQAVYTLTNTTNAVVDYSNTNECDLGPGVTPVTAMASIGTTGARGTTLLWGGFSLAPAQSEQITLVLDVTPSGAAAGLPAPIIPAVRTEGVLLNGGFFMTPGDALVSSSVSGLLNGGIVLAAPPPPRVDAPAVVGATAGTGGPTGGAVASIVVTSPIAPSQPGTAALPRSGTGMAGSDDHTSRTWMLAAVVLAATLTGALLLRRQRID